MYTTLNSPSKIMNSETENKRIYIDKAKIFNPKSPEAIIKHISGFASKKRLIHSITPLDNQRTDKKLSIIDTKIQHNLFSNFRDNIQSNDNRINFSKFKEKILEKIILPKIRKKIKIYKLNGKKKMKMSIKNHSLTKKKMLTKESLKKEKAIKNDSFLQNLSEDRKSVV